MQKRNKMIYWIATALLAFGMLISGVQQLVHTKQMAAMVAHLGYPPYFMDILGVWKILGVIAILIPGFKLVKEWAYAGFFFAMTGALVSHLAIKDDGLKEIAGPIMQTVFIILSWYFRPVDKKIVLVN